MTTKHRTQDLCSLIETIVHQHINESRLAAMEAMQRAFSHFAGTPKIERKAPAKRTRKNSKRRLKDEVRAMSDALYREVCSAPGASMSVLAAKLRMRAKELHLPMAHLKRTDQVRSVGERSSTCYFPIVAVNT